MHALSREAQRKLADCADSHVAQRVGVDAGVARSPVQGLCSHCIAFCAHSMRCTEKLSTELKGVTIRCVEGAAACQNSNNSNYHAAIVIAAFIASALRRLSINHRCVWRALGGLGTAVHLWRGTIDSLRRVLGGPVDLGGRLLSLVYVFSVSAWYGRVGWQLVAWRHFLCRLRLSPPQHPFAQEIQYLEICRHVFPFVRARNCRTKECAEETWMRGSYPGSSSPFGAATK